MSTTWYEFNPDEESLDECRARRLMHMPTLSSVQIEALRQLRISTWDGNLISKSARSELFQKGLIVCLNGWQVVSIEGLAVLETLGYLDERERH